MLTTETNAGGTPTGKKEIMTSLALLV